jgi:hypothetical protein
MIFHPGRKLDVKYFGEALHDQIVDDKSQFTGDKITLDHFHIGFSADSGQNRGIRTGPTDPVFFKGLDQGCF